MPSCSPRRATLARPLAILAAVTVLSGRAALGAIYEVSAPAPPSARAVAPSHYAMADQTAKRLTRRSTEAIHNVEEPADQQAISDGHGTRIGVVAK